MTGGTRSAKPECATMEYWVIRDENSVGGAAQYSAALTAYATKKPVKVYGAGTCTRWGDGEDIEKISLVE